LGKRFGGTMVKLVCRLSFERSTCVRKTEDYFTKYGEQALLVAKFVPGLGTVAAPIAGQTGMKYRVFLAYDLAGALFWAATITMAGRFFGDVLRVHPGRFPGWNISRAHCSCSPSSACWAIGCGSSRPF
jgi:membrane protein DedA with SNARE-associated domain